MEGLLSMSAGSSPTMKKTRTAMADVSLIIGYFIRISGY